MISSAENKDGKQIPIYSEDEIGIKYYIKYNSPVLGNILIDFTIYYIDEYSEKGIMIVIDTEPGTDFVLKNQPLFKCKNKCEFELKLSDTLKVYRDYSLMEKTDFDNIKTLINNNLEPNLESNYNEKVREYKAKVFDIIKDTCEFTPGKKLYEHQQSKYLKFVDIIERAQAQTDQKLESLEAEALKDFMFDPEMLEDLQSQTDKITKSLANLINVKKVDSAKVVDSFEIYWNNIANAMFSEIEDEFSKVAKQ